jgi:steroid delta-isomerase-like uncharacterized protein
MTNVIEADSMIEAAKASIIAYNHKDWNKAEESLHEGAVYDEKATHRRIEGRDDIIRAWQGWAKAFPDSKATFVREHRAGNIVVLEVVWKGIQSGPLDMPTGTIPASNRELDMPSCQVFEIEDGKVATFTQYFDLLTMLRQIGAA